jgi:hypothetical protein
MKELSRFSKILLFLAFLSGSLWIGAYLTRLFLAYQLFEAKDLALKSFVNQQNLSGILYSMLPAISTSFILYIVLLVTYTAFLLTSKISLKKNGWLFIISLIIYLTMPMEAYLMTIDYKMITQLNSGAFDPGFVLSLLTDRIKVLSSFPLVEIFCYFSIVYFILFQPLTVKDKKAA